MDKLLNKYEKYFSKYKKNTLLSAILYSYKYLTEEEFHNLYIVPKKLLNIPDDSADLYSFNLINGYISLKLEYSLPHMLNKYKVNNVICLHHIYGEAMVHLVIMCLLTENTDVFNDEHLMDYYLNKKAQPTIYLPKNLTSPDNFTKKELEDDYTKKISKLYENIFHDIQYFNKNILKTDYYAMLK